MTAWSLVERTCFSITDSHRKNEEEEKKPERKRERERERDRETERQRKRESKYRLLTVLAAFLDTVYTNVWERH